MQAHVFAKLWQCHFQSYAGARLYERASFQGFVNVIFKAIYKALEMTFPRLFAKLCQCHLRARAFTSARLFKVLEMSFPKLTGRARSFAKLWK